MPVVLALSAVVPALLLMWYFWSRDAYPEPPRVVWTTFAVGVLSTVPVVIVAVPVDAAFEGVSDPWTAGLGTAFLAAAIPEDLAKFCILYFYCLRHAEFDEPMDGLVYGAAASMGFAALENLLYVYEGGLGVAATRAVTAVPSHAMHGAIMGYFLALYHFVPARRGFYLLQALAVPMLLHGLYDFPLMTAERLGEDHPAAVFLFVGTLAVVSVELGFALALLKRVRAIQAQRAGAPAAEQDIGVLDAYHRRGASTRRLAPWLFLVFGGLLAWFGVGGAMGTGIGAVTGYVGGPALVALGINLLIAFFGIRLFRKGIARLNRQPGGDGRPTGPRRPSA
ncbi:MAG: PrsW family glutamic-type intramembrane protease [Alphaproteobacteria bacterium]